MYADDRQIYLNFKKEESNEKLNQMEICVEAIRDWMRNNFFKLNDNKTGFLTIESRWEKS